MIVVPLEIAEWLEGADLLKKEEANLINANIIIGDHQPIVETLIKFLQVENYL